MQARTDTENFDITQVVKVKRDIISSWLQSIQTLKNIINYYNGRNSFTEDARVSG